MKSLANRAAVVTGASSGIGAATARLLAAKGAKVALLARRTDRLDQLAQEIKEAGGEALALTVDTTDAASVAAAADQVRETFGPVDLVINNAGVMLPAPIQARKTADWRREVDVNINGVLNTIDAFLPDLLAAGAEDRPADLVNTSSIVAQVVFPGFAVYNATKAAVSHLSRTMRAELGPQGVRVTAVEPAMTTTELQGHVTDEGVNAFVGQWRAAFEWLTSENIADVIAFTVEQPKHVNLSQITVYPTRQP
ncbi:SDR family oxidoreductase [Nonomuraea sp. NBC_01738]|uniref:SDR family oxidoreductase n=1 Tax=Nonomuraea sp. NBC_01738 TaxID=2976003 RepID=UPI002E13A1AA|nr:SDR family oxidoreductase [Nonomuraea sp. NBC_01738]